MRGIDISHYQKDLDLSALRADGSQFVILKLSEGRGIPDESFDRFYEQAQALGIQVGAYVYSHATNASVAQEEAVYALSLLKGRILPLGIFMDVEEPEQMRTPRDQLMQTVTAFCRTVERSGYSSGIYGSEFNLWTRISVDDVADSLIWVAHYGREPDIPCDLWQSGDNGVLPGYGAPVDTDVVRSDRFRELVTAANRPDGQCAEPQKADPVVRMLQCCMAQDGYWQSDRIDGQKSQEFREKIKEYAADVAAC